MMVAYVPRRGWMVDAGGDLLPVLVCIGPALDPDRTYHIDARLAGGWLRVAEQPETLVLA